MYCCIMLEYLISFYSRGNSTKTNVCCYSLKHIKLQLFFRLWNIKGLTHTDFQILFDFENDLNKGRGSFTITISASCDVTNGCCAERCVSADAF